MVVNGGGPPKNGCERRRCDWGGRGGDRTEGWSEGEQWFGKVSVVSRKWAGSGQRGVVRGRKVARNFSLENLQPFRPSNSYEINKDYDFYRVCGPGRREPGSEQLWANF